MFAGIRGAQAVSNVCAQVVVVIHHEYALLYVISLHRGCKGVGIRLTLHVFLSALLHVLLPVYHQGEHSALRLIVGNGDGATMHTHIFTYDMQAYATASLGIIGTHLIEALEDARLVGIAHAAASVGNRDTQLLVCRQRHLYATAVGSVLQRIGQQVIHYLIQFLSVNSEIQVLTLRLVAEGYSPVAGIILE